ncbi:hypothetical protein ES705_05935 [subsurface metagenome]
MRAMRYYELCDFELCLNGKKIKEMLENDEKKKKGEGGTSDS